MLFFSEPSAAQVADFIVSQQNQSFTYSAVGATNTTPPADFTIDRNKIELGKGVETFDRAVTALKQWRQFKLGWVSLVPEGIPIEVGATVAVKAYAFGSWSLNATRIVYVINEQRRFGFAYGTLPDHLECGEERFLVEWKADDSVVFDILAFSKPRHPLIKMSRPLARVMQKRFAREAMRRMVEEVKGQIKM